MNEGFSRDPTNTMGSPCLVHFKVELSRSPGGQGSALISKYLGFGSVISTTSPNHNQSLQELKN